MMKKGEVAHNYLGERAKFTLRLPPPLAKKIRKAAKRNKTTVTAWMMKTMEDALVK